MAQSNSKQVKDPPSRPASALGLSVTMALCTGVLLALMAMLVGTWQDEGSQAGAMIQARAIADATSRIDSGTDEGVALLQHAIAGVKEKLPGLHEALILEGTEFLAHTDPAMVGTRLQREGEKAVEHKALYDDIDAFQDNIERNRETREKYRDLKKNPYDVAIVNWVGDELFVAAPIMEGTEGVRGLVALKVDPMTLESGSFALWFALIGAGLIIFAWLLTRLMPGFPQAYVGFLFMLATGLATWQLLDNCTSELRQRLAGTTASAYVVWDNMLTSAAGLSDFRAPESSADFARAINLTAKGDPSRYFEGISVPLSSGTPLASLEASKVQCGPFLKVDAKWAWLSLGFVSAMMLLYLTLLLTGRTRKIADVFNEHWYAYAYVAPAVIGAVVLVFGPFFYAIFLAFHMRIHNSLDFVGLFNFKEILSNFDIGGTKNFYRTLGVTVMWTAINVSLHVSIGLGLAMILKDKSLKFTPAYRTLLIIPWALPNYITALIWQGMFNKEYGAVNAVLGLLGLEPVSWFTTFWGAFTANLVTNVWLGFPFMMVISLGALQSIPADLYEAADVDGAGRWDKFRRITLPLLKPALFPAIILGIIWTFNNFNVIYLVSGGGPDNKTDILITEAYRWAFEQGRYGYASAYSTIIFVILFGYTYVTNKITKSTEGAYE